MKTYKRICKKSLNKAVYKNHQDFINAIDDICGDCVKKVCAWHDLITSYKVYKYSHNFFSFDCFVGAEEIGKNKRNGKNGAGEKLDIHSLSRREQGELDFNS